MKPKPKKRWRPKEGQKYWYVCEYGVEVAKWSDNVFHVPGYYFLGSYKTKREAEAMAKKIRAFVAREIGEVWAEYWQVMK